MLRRSVRRKKAVIKKELNKDIVIEIMKLLEKEELTDKEFDELQYYESNEEEFVEARRRMKLKPDDVSDDESDDDIIYEKTIYRSTAKSEIELYEQQIKDIQLSLYHSAPDAVKQEILLLISNGMSTAKVKHYHSYRKLNKLIFDAILPQGWKSLELDSLTTPHDSVNLNSPTRLWYIGVPSHAMFVFNTGEEHILYDANGSKKDWFYKLDEIFENLKLANFHPHKTEKKELANNIFINGRGRCVCWTLFVGLLLQHATDDNYQDIHQYIVNIADDKARVLSQMVMCFYIRLSLPTDNEKYTPMQKKLMCKIKGVKDSFKRVLEFRDMVQQKIHIDPFFKTIIFASWYYPTGTGKNEHHRVENYKRIFEKMRGKIVIQQKQPIHTTLVILFESHDFSISVDVVHADLERYRIQKGTTVTWGDVFDVVNGYIDAQRKFWTDVGGQMINFFKCEDGFITGNIGGIISSGSRDFYALKREYNTGSKFINSNMKFNIKDGEPIKSKSGLIHHKIELKFYLANKTDKREGVGFDDIKHSLEMEDFETFKKLISQKDYLLSYSDSYVTVVMQIMLTRTPAVDKFLEILSERCERRDLKGNNFRSLFAHALHFAIKKGDTNFIPKLSKIIRKNKRLHFRYLRSNEKIYYKQNGGLPNDKHSGTDKETLMEYAGRLSITLKNKEKHKELLIIIKQIEKIIEEHDAEQILLKSSLGKRKTLVLDLNKLKF
jgi:hypothetical protein